MALNIPKLGDNVLQTDIDQTEEINSLIDFLSTTSGIVEYDFGENGYVRFDNGFQIAWVSIIGNAGGTGWGSLFYSDINLPNWKKPFTNIVNVLPSIDSRTYWPSIAGFTNESAGILRALRPTDGVADIRVYAIGFGVYK